MNLTYHLPDGMSPQAIEKVIPELEYAVNGKVEVETQGRNVIVKVRKGQIPAMKKFELIEKSGGLTIPIGYSYDGLITLDMASDSHCYMLVGGNPGTGKSNFLNQVIYSVTQNYGPEEVRLAMIDLKLGVEFGGWEQEEHTWQYAYDPMNRKLDHVIEELNKKIRSRMKEFKRAGVKKIAEYNKLPDVEPMPYILLIVDEFAELHDKADDDAEKVIKSMLQIGRAAGLRAILATQRPTVDNISGSIKALLTDRLAFKVATELNSRVILDVAGAEELPDIPGRAILLTGAKFTEVQTMLYE